MDLKQLQTQNVMLISLIEQYKAINNAFYTEIASINDNNGQVINVNLDVLNTQLSYLLTSIQTLVQDQKSQQVLVDNEQYIKINTTLMINVTNLQQQITTLQNQISDMQIVNTSTLATVIFLNNQIDLLTSQYTADQSSITKLQQQISK